MERSLRYRAAVRIARVAAGLARRLPGRSGSVIGGAVLLRLAPDGLAATARRRRITLVTGTNGKSTTTAMVVAALRTRQPVATNADGANTPHGLAWTVATATSYDIVLEVDESWLPWAVRTLRPQGVALLNLTRDQLHRKPEIRPLAASWRTWLAAVPRVVANADDPAVVWAASAAPAADYVAAGTTWTADAVVCPACGALLDRDGDDWWCACGLVRPVPTLLAEGDAVIEDGRSIGRYDGLPGAANVANAVVAVAVARWQIPSREALRALSTQVREVSGRYGEVTYEGRRVRLLLAKNPAGWDAALDMLRDDAAVLLAVSAEGIDGRDTSWLYDVAFERLGDRIVAVTGSRGTDLLVRLGVAGLTVGEAWPSVAVALAALPEGPVDVLATYAAFQSARRELRVA